MSGRRCGISRSLCPPGARGPTSDVQRPAFWLPTALCSAPPVALQFAHVNHKDNRPQNQVPLHAVRDERRALRMREVLLPLPVANRCPPLPGWPSLLSSLPRGLRLQAAGLGRHRIRTTVDRLSGPISRSQTPAGPRISVGAFLLAHFCCRTSTEWPERPPHPLVFPEESA